VGLVGRWAGQTDVEGAQGAAAPRYSERGRSGIKRSQAKLTKLILSGNMTSARVGYCSSPELNSGAIISFRSEARRNRWHDPGDGIERANLHQLPSGGKPLVD
jgi:hypothetical protein